MTKTQNKRADSAPRQDLKMYDPTGVVVIGIDTKADPSHWGYDEDSNQAPVREEDVQFTYEYGIIQNVIGRRDGDKIIIVAGRGRTRQLREANKRRVTDGLTPWLLPVRIERGDARKMLVLKHGENSHRRDQTPFARARQADELSKQFPEAEAAAIMGLGVKQYKDLLKLLDVSPAVKKAVLQGNLGQTSAIELAALPEASQAEQLAEILATSATSGGKTPTIRDVKAKVRELSGKAPLETPGTRLKKVAGILDKLEDSATKDDLWSVIQKIRKVLK